MNPISQAMTAALLEIDQLRAERDALLAENEKLSDLWSLIKAERDALKATLAQPEQERVETYIHEFTKQPHPGDFGIPRGHWWQAKQYADSLQPEQAEHFGVEEPGESHHPGYYFTDRNK